jgi:hypothetical protein
VAELNLIPDNEVVYRALRSASCIDQETGEVSPEAYFIRADEEGNPKENGLSVCLSSRCAAEDCCKTTLKKRKGVVSLNVNYLRSIGLDVQPDPPPPEHAIIVNVPVRKENPKEAERFARLLAKHSKFQWKP